MEHKNDIRGVTQVIVKNMLLKIGPDFVHLYRLPYTYGPCSYIIGLFVSDYSKSIYYVARFHVAHKSFPVVCIYFNVILFKSYYQGDNPVKIKTKCSLTI